MARISHTSEKSKSSNRPAKKYLEWKSNDKSFEYYDSALKEKLLSEGKTEDEIKKNKLANVKVDLPLKFVFLQHYHTVKGWHDASESKIWSNEVYYIGSEPMTVRSFGNKKKNLPAVEIVSGIYTDIKPKIIDLVSLFSSSGIERILNQTNIAPELIAVENIEFPFDATRKLIDKYGLSICFDTGHLLVGYSGKDTVFEFLDKHYDKIIEFHLNDGKILENGRPNDHIAIGDGSFPMDAGKYINQAFLFPSLEAHFSKIHPY